MKVRITRGLDGWHYAGDDLQSIPLATYSEAIRSAVAGGHEIDNAGWRHRLLMWNFHGHALDGYPGWEIERERQPAFAKLTHKRGSGPVESHKIAAEWDDIAAVDFYQRDRTDDGLNCVNKDQTYWSGWWFATIAERNRFLEWRTTAVRTDVAVPESVD